MQKKVEENKKNTPFNFFRKGKRSPGYKYKHILLSAAFPWFGSLCGKNSTSAPLDPLMPDSTSNSQGQPKKQNPHPTAPSMVPAQQNGTATSQTENLPLDTVPSAPPLEDTMGDFDPNDLPPSYEEAMRDDRTEEHIGQDAEKKAMAMLRSRDQSKSIHRQDFRELSSYEKEIRSAKKNMKKKLKQCKNLVRQVQGKKQSEVVLDDTVQGYDVLLTQKNGFIPVPAIVRHPSVYVKRRFNAYLLSNKTKEKSAKISVLERSMSEFFRYVDDAVQNCARYGALLTQNFANELCEKSEKRLPLQPELQSIFAFIQKRELEEAQDALIRFHPDKGFFFRSSEEKVYVRLRCACALYIANAMFEGELFNRQLIGDNDNETLLSNKISCLVDSLNYLVAHEYSNLDGIFDREKQLLNEQKLRQLSELRKRINAIQALYVEMRTFVIMPMYSDMHTPKGVVASGNKQPIPAASGILSPGIPCR